MITQGCGLIEFLKSVELIKSLSRCVEVFHLEELDGVLRTVGQRVGDPSFPPV